MKSNRKKIHDLVDSIRASIKHAEEFALALDDSPHLNSDADVEYAEKLEGALFDALYDFRHPQTRAAK